MDSLLVASKPEATQNPNRKLHKIQTNLVFLKRQKASVRFFIFYLQRTTDAIRRLYNQV